MPMHFGMMMHFGHACMLVMHAVHRRTGEQLKRHCRALGSLMASM